jgi:hypothetical protein
MLEAIKDNNTTPRGIYLANFGLNSKPCWWVSGKRTKYILSLFFLILKRTLISLRSQMDFNHFFQSPKA